MPMLTFFYYSAAPAQICSSVSRLHRATSQGCLAGTDSCLPTLDAPLPEEPIPTRASGALHGNMHRQLSVSPSVLALDRPGAKSRDSKLKARYWSVPTLRIRYPNIQISGHARKHGAGAPSAGHQGLRYHASYSTSRLPRARRSDV